MSAMAAPPPPLGLDCPIYGWLIFQADGSAGSGMILRDDKGAVIFAAYKRLYFCNDALEAEIHVIMEAIDLAIQRTTYCNLVTME